MTTLWRRVTSSFRRGRLSTQKRDGNGGQPAVIPDQARSEPEATKVPVP